MTLPLAVFQVIRAKLPAGLEVSLLEAKQAVESLAARHGLVLQRTECLGMVLAVVLVAVTLGMAMY